MKLLAFDLSLTATGYAEYIGAIRHGVLNPPKGMEGIGRLNWIRYCVLNLCEGSDLVVFEGLSYGSNDPSAQERAGLAYLIRMALWERGMQFVLCAPTTLKKWVTGKGSAPKDIVIKEIFRRFHHDVSDNNVADAIGLLYLGMALIGEYTPEIEPQREVLATIQKANPWLSRFAGAARA